MFLWEVIQLFNLLLISLVILLGLTFPGIFEPMQFRDNGSSNPRSSDEANKVYGRADCLDITRGRSSASGLGGKAPWSQ